MSSARPQHPNPPEQFGPYSLDAVAAITFAQVQARASTGIVSMRHLLLGLLHVDHGTAAKALGSLGVTLETIRTPGNCYGKPHGEEPFLSVPPFERRARRVMDKAFSNATEDGHQVDTGDLLVALMIEATDAESYTD